MIKTKEELLRECDDALLQSLIPNRTNLYKVKFYTKKIQNEPTIEYITGKNIKNVVDKLESLYYKSQLAIEEISFIHRVILRTTNIF